MKKATFLLSVIFFCSCDALNQNPSTAVTTDTAITSLNDLSNAINGAYYIVTYGTTLTMGSELSIYADLVGPDSYQPSSSGQNASRIAQLSLTPNDTYNAYYYLYAALANVNKAIEQVHKPETRRHGWGYAISGGAICHAWAFPFPSCCAFRSPSDFRKRQHHGHCIIRQSIRHQSHRSSCKYRRDILLYCKQPYTSH